MLKRPYPPEEWKGEEEVERESQCVNAPARPPLTSATSPSFYCVTVNYRSIGYLRGLIDSLVPVKSLKKIIVVNHSAEDDLTELEAPFPIQIISQENRGYGAGLNRGFREIDDTNAVVLMCNPDVCLERPDAVQEALEHMAANRGIGCMVPNMVDANMQSLFPGRTFYTPTVLMAVRSPVAIRNRIDSYRKHLYVDVERNRPMEVEWGSGAALLYRVGALPGPKVFDEKFFLYMEDVDLCARLWKSGHSVVTFPNLIFSHHAQRNSSKKLRFFYHHLSSLLKFCFKYRGLPKFDDLRNGSKERTEATNVAQSTS